MKTNRFLNIKKKKFSTKVIVKISTNTIINVKQTELLFQKYNHNFYNLVNIKKSLFNNIQIEFNEPKGINLYERLKKPISEYDFLFIIEQFIDVVRKLEKIGLPGNNLVLDFKYVSFDESTKDLFFIYIPIANPHYNKNYISFVEQVIYSAKPLEIDSNYLSNFLYFIKQLKVFDVDKIESYIYKIDSSIVNIIKNTCKKENNFISSTGNSSCEIISNKNFDNELTDLIVDDEMTDIMSNDGQNDIIFDDEQTDLMENDELANTLSNGLDINVFIENNNDESTCLLNDNEAINLSETGQNTKNKFPVLVRSFTEEVIRINKPVFRIGKDENCVDYVVTNNIAISRSHADIISRNGRYFVFDLRSKNKSYINNRVLPTEQEVEIFNGDVLKLANEDFLFQV